jgi:hypothetical protein
MYDEFDFEIHEIAQIENKAHFVSMSSLGMYIIMIHVSLNSVARRMISLSWFDENLPLDLSSRLVTRSITEVFVLLQDKVQLSLSCWFWAF